MDFAESPEHEMMRAAVRDLAGRFGHDYYAEQVRSGQKTDELRRAAQGCPLLLLLVTAAICGEFVAQYGTARAPEVVLTGRVEHHGCTA